MASLFDTLLPIDQLNGLVGGAENAVVSLFGFGHTKSNGSAKSAQNLDGFKSEVLGKGNSEESRFDIMMSSPKCLVGTPWTQYGQPSLYRVEAVTFPGLNLILKSRQIYGAPTMMPIAADYGGQNGITITYLCDRDMNVKKMMDAWIGSVVDLASQTVAYPDTYTTTISMAKLDRLDMIVYTLELEDAYPVRVSEMQGNMHSHEFQRIQVTFAYRKWQCKEVQAYANAKAATNASTVNTGSVANGLTGSTSVADPTIAQRAAAIQSISSSYGLTTTISGISG